MPVHDPMTKWIFDDSPVADPIASRIILNSLKGSPLIDLGGGTNSALSRFAITAGATQYLNVEIAAGPKEPTTPIWLPDHGPSDLMPAAILAADILDVLWRLPADSCNVAINAIDSFVIPLLASRQSGAGYPELLVKHLERIVPPGGVVFGISSDVFDHLLKSDCLESLLDNTEPYGAFRKTIPTSPNGELRCLTGAKDNLPWNM